MRLAAVDNALAVDKGALPKIRCVNQGYNILGMYWKLGTKSTVIKYITILFIYSILFYILFTSTARALT